MRFRATLAPEQVAHLYALVGPLAKLATQRLHSSHGLPHTSSLLGHNCLLSLDSEMFNLSVDLPPTEGMTCVASVQAKGGLFLEHRIESNADDNRIVLRVDLAQFRTALHSIQQQITQKNHHSYRAGSSSASSSLFATAAPTLLTVLKLAKRNSMPCLCLEAKTAMRMEIHQIIPVQVQRPTEWNEDRIWPDLPSSPTVQLMLSPAAGLTLKALLDAVKQSSSSTSTAPTSSSTSLGQTVRHILFTGNATTAEMRLQCHHDNGVQWQTLLLGQAMPRDANLPVSSSSSSAATVRVDAAQVACVLQHGAWTTEWSWIPNVALVVVVRLDPVGACTYVLPVHYLEDQDDQDNDVVA